MKTLPPQTYFKNKRVLLRVDFNVAIENNRVIDDFDLLRSLKTINYVAPLSRYVLLISHLGNLKEGGQLGSLAPVAHHLSRLLKKKIYFVFGPLEELKETLAGLPQGALVLLENIRFYSGEYSEQGYVNSASFSKRLAQLGDCYINEAFGESHRKVSSIVGITRYLPSFAGFNLVEEVKNLNRVRENFQRPLVVILGGAKLKTKLPLIKSLTKKAEAVLLGGALANTFLKSLGLEIGKSLWEEKFLQSAQRLATLKSVYLPVDFGVATSFRASRRLEKSDSLSPSQLILDLGPETIRQYQRLIAEAKTILWNGPMGYYENPVFARGTREIIKAIWANQQAFKVIGGGDTLASLKKLFPQLFSQLREKEKRGELNQRHLFLSTGGGAMLEYLAGKELPGIKALEEA